MFLTILTWVVSVGVAYALVGSAFHKAVKHIRDFDLERGLNSSAEFSFNHDEDNDSSVPSLVAVFWPLAGIPSLLWHLKTVDWTKDERLLVRDIWDAQNKPTDVTEELRGAVKRINEERHREMEKPKKVEPKHARLLT